MGGRRGGWDGGRNREWVKGWGHRLNTPAYALFLGCPL